METQTKRFGEMNFSHIQLGDARRTNRLVKLVDLMCRRLGGTLPQKLNAPKDLRAFYRLMNCDEVTHEAILSAHRDVVLKKIAQTESTVLMISDATELDYTKHESLSELGQIGNRNHRGTLLKTVWPSMARRAMCWGCAIRFCIIATRSLRKKRRHKSGNGSREKVRCG